MRLTFVKGIAVGAATAALTLAATAALAGTGIGANFDLGKVNTVNATSTLTGSAAGSLLDVTNSSTAAAARGLHVTNHSATAAAVRGDNKAAGPGGAFASSGPAATFTVPAGQPPFTVNSPAEVTNLNAALLQGKAPADFYAAGSTVANSTELGGQPASAFGDRWFAVVPANGGLVVGNGVSSTQHDGTGSYDVRFTGSIANTANCAVFAQLMSGIGWVVAEPSTEGIMTEFDVHVYDTAGNPADARFSLLAAC